MYTINGPVGLIGDIHAEDTKLAHVITYLHAHNIRTILCTGDITDGSGDVNRCIELIQKHSIITVIGNHDQWVLRNEMRYFSDATHLTDLNEQSRKFLQSLPTTIDLQIQGYTVLLCHGIADNTMNKVDPDDYGYAIESNFGLQKIIKSGKYRYILNGHSHKKMVKPVESLTIINAGTLLHEHNPCFATIDAAFQRITYYSLEHTDIQRDAEISLI